MEYSGIITVNLQDGNEAETEFHRMALEELMEEVRRTYSTVSSVVIVISF